MAEHVRGAPVGAEGYVHYRCRCDDCKTAYAALGENARERRLRGPTPIHVHGTWNGYSNYGCRCDKCLEACRAKYPYGAAWRAANRADLRLKKRERVRRKKSEGS